MRRWGSRPVNTVQPGWGTTGLQRDIVRAVGLVPVIAAALGTAGCTATNAAPGVVRFSLENSLPDNTAPPPSGLAGEAEAIRVPPAPRNGAYAGFGYNIVDPGGMCAGKIRIYNFHVEGNRVIFGAYRGTIQPDGHLRMQAGGTYIYGQFVGSHFEGRYWQPGPACTYTMSLEPVA